MEEGGFFHVPVGLVHRDVNPLDEPQEFVIAFVGEGPLVVNLDGPSLSEAASAWPELVPEANEQRRVQWPSQPPPRSPQRRVDASADSSGLIRLN